MALAGPQAPAVARSLAEIAQDVLFETIHKIGKILFWRLKPSEVRVSLKSQMLALIWL